jgi:hypothetical protein
MHLARGAGVVLLCLGGALGGCAGLKPDAPQGAQLAGSWKLDPAASDDPQKVLEHMRQEAYKILSRNPAYSQAPPTRAGRGQGQAQGPGDEDYTNAYAGPPRGDPLKQSPMAHTIMSAAERGEYLTIRQAPDEFAVDYGTVRRSFTPGGHSVVSAEGGVADQTSGWDGRSYVVIVKEQYGSTVKEEYSLASDGALIDRLHVGAAELPAVDLKRVYRPSHDKNGPLTPSND